MKMKQRTTFLRAVAFSACASLAACGEAAVDAPELKIAIAPAIGAAPAAPAAPPVAELVSSGNGIDYHGGPVMGGTVNIYYIWYGNWSGNSAPQILGDWASNIGNSPIYRINSSYGDNGQNVSGQTRFAGSTSVGYTHGNHPVNGDVRSIVDDAISSGSLPADPNAVYFVLTSSDVDEGSGFCSQYCGWHSYANRNGSAVKFSFVGDSARCNGSCGSAASPNGNASADAMASIIYHELSEAVTDPLINAWFDGSGAENGDKCAWKFGTTYRTGNGGLANVRLGNRDYLLQSNWLNAGGGSCVLAGGPSGGGGDVLSAGASLAVNQAIVSPDRQNRAVMQADGSFVVTLGGVQAWTSGTAGTGANHVSMQTDGNLVVYDAGNGAKWASNTWGSGADTLKMQNDGNLVVYAPSGAKWASNTNRNRGASASAPTTLAANYRLMSPDGRFEALMQTDGNFVVYQGGTALWATGTNGASGNSFAVQSDGNLVVYDAANHALWASGTNGRGGTRLAMQNDGNLVLYTAANVAVWSSSTGGH